MNPWRPCLEPFWDGLEAQIVNTLWNNGNNEAFAHCQLEPNLDFAVLAVESCHPNSASGFYKKTSLFSSCLPSTFADSGRSTVAQLQCLNSQHGTASKLATVGARHPSQQSISSECTKSGHIESPSVHQGGTSLQLLM